MTSCTWSPWRCQRRSTPSRRKPSRVERRLRARVVEVGVGAEPLEPEPLERQPGDQRLGLRRSRRCPSGLRPSHVPTTARRSRRLNSDSPVTPSGRAVGVDDQEVESLAALALAPRVRRCTPRARSIDVYGPHEKNRVTSGSEPSASSAAASAGVAIAQHRGTGRPSAPRAMVLLRGGRRSPALRRPRQPARAGGGARRRAARRRRRGSCSAATTRCSGRGRPRRVAALRELRPRELDPRQRRPLDRVPRSGAGSTRSLQRAVADCREALGADAVAAARRAPGPGRARRRRATATPPRPPT